MKKSRLILGFITALLFSVVITGCNKDNPPGDDHEDKTAFTDLKIDPNFKFDMTKEVDVILSINSNNPKEPQQKFYIYNGDPDNDGKLLASGLTSPYLVYQTRIKVASYLEKLWVVRKDVFGGVDKQSFDISSGLLHHTYDVTLKSCKQTRALNLLPDPGCNNCTPVTGVHPFLVVDNNYCVPAGQVLNATNVRFEGGTLVICGVANITNITVQGTQGGSLIISTGGNANIINAQTSHLDYFVNFGIVNLTGKLVVSQGCKFENQNIFRSTWGFDNYSDHYYNTGIIQQSGGGFNNNGKMINTHIMQLSGHFNNNSNSEIINDCRIDIAGNFNQNASLENNGYIQINGAVHFNGSSNTIMGPQALINGLANVFIDGTVEGPTVSCAKIDIAGVCTVNGSGHVFNNMDLCAAVNLVNNGQIDNTVTFCDCYIPTNECNPGSGDPGDGGGGGNDSDNDGCPDDVDEYPNDPERCSNDYYPEEGVFGTLAFEDLWNATGDYDFNDLVVNFNYKTVKNAQNKVVEIFAKFHVAALGADLNNGFGIEFNTPTNTIDTVIGNVILGSAVTLNDKGAELGPLNRAVVIVFDALNDYAGTSMVNTVPGGNAKDFDTIDVYIKFNHSVADMEQAPFNPFMFIDQERGKETHMIDHAPTELVNPVYFGQNSDDSDPATGRYYVTATNLPWVIEIPETFDWPVETADILTAYLKFQEWAESSGQVYDDWYKDLPGYREPANIYKTAQP